MQSSAQKLASGRDSVIVNVNRIASNSKRGAGGGEIASWMIFVLALVIGYAMGSTSTTLSLGSIGRTAWKGIAVFEEWVREVVVPIYTLIVLFYLFAQNYGDKPIKASSTKAKQASTNYSKPLSIIRSTLSSFSLPPALRMLSSMTVSDEEAESNDSLATLSSSQVVDEKDGEEEPTGEKPIDMTGTFKVVENNNFGEFLKAQGVPWFLCNAASKARPTHNFTHVSARKLTIQIRGIIESETSYQIDGPFTETSIRGRFFQDSVSYLYDESGNASDDRGNELSESNEKICIGVQTRKIAVGEGYVVHVERRVIRAGTTWIPNPEENPDGHCTYDLDTLCDFDRLIMTNKIVYDGDRDEAPVIASQLFHRTD